MKYVVLQYKKHQYQKFCGDCMRRLHPKWRRCHKCKSFYVIWYDIKWDNEENV